MRAAIGLGASLSSGNSKTSNLWLQADAVRATTQDKTSLYGSALYARADGTTTSQQAKLGGHYDFNLTPDYFAFGGLDFERNKFSNVKLRSQIGGGLGWHMIKAPTTAWDLFGGAAYTDDKYFDPMTIDGAVRTSYRYPSLLLGEESPHKLSDTTSARQRLVLYPNLKNSGEYRATWDAAQAVAMTKTLSLNVGFSASYNSDPGLGRKSTDTLLTTGVSMRFD